jgi:L-aspartate semialdehyde sulfurtransferase
VVTTGTFGAMCSSGAFFNFGHSDPPIRMEKVWLNEVEAYAGIAAVDAYLGATQKSETQGTSYGGAHVLEDLVAGNSVQLRAQSKGTDCYPRKTLEIDLTLEDMNQATMVNPRNSYQSYVAASNTTDRTLYTYMGALLPNTGNVSYSGAGCLSPIPNDPDLRIIGSGVPIFLCGAEGMIIGEGTQASPGNGFATLMTTGDMNGMSTDFLRAATFKGYNSTLYVGLGVPIPVLDEDIVRRTAVRDEDLKTTIADYGVPNRDRPTLREVTYAELKSGLVEMNGEEVKTSSLSSYKKALEVADELKAWVESGRMELALPTRRMNTQKTPRPMRDQARTPLVRDIMNTNLVTIGEDEKIQTAAKRLLKGEINHLPVLDDTNRLVGIVTTFDISKAVAASNGKGETVRDIMTRRVVSTSPTEPVDVATRKLEKNNISALPVVDETGKLVGILSAIDLGKLFERGWKR